MKNERGYTLVIVLLMITLIFTFSVVLIADSVNSAKQNTQTETHYRATQIAEMGIVYVQESLRGLSLADLKNDSKIETHIAGLNTIPKDIDSRYPEREFEFDNINAEIDLTRDDENYIYNIVKFSSIGKEKDGKKSELQAEIEIKVPLRETINPDFTGDPFIPPSGYITIDRDKIVIIEDSHTFSNGPDIKEGATLAIGGDAKFSGDLQVGDGAKLLVCNDSDLHTATNYGNNDINFCNNAKFGGDINFRNNTTVNIRHNAIFNQAFEIGDLLNNQAGNHTEINIGNDLTVQTDTSISEGTIRVFGNASFGRGISTFENSNLMVYGDLKLLSNIDQYNRMTSGVCAKEIITDGWTEVEREDLLGIKRLEGIESCESVAELGIYELPDLKMPADKDSYFQVCGNSCTLNDGLDIGIDYVEY